MPLPIIVSVTRRDNGREANFLLIEGTVNGGPVCLGCGTYLWDRLTPVEVADGGEVDQDATGDCSPLCRVCSYTTGKRIVASWPVEGLGSDEVSSLWRQVNAEQARDAERELERDRATALEETQRAFAASKKARPHQGVDCAAEVA